MVRTLFVWELRRLETGLGTGTWLALLGFPLLYFVPWTTFEYFESTAQAVVILSSLYAVMLAAVAGGESGSMRAASFWLYQKGIDQADIAITTWCINAAICLVLLIYCGMGASAAAVFRDAFTIRDTLIAFAAAVLLFCVVHATLLLIVSIGIRQRAEVLMALLLISLLQGLLFDFGAIASRAAHLLLPPFGDVFQLIGAAARGRWRDSLGLALHLSVYVFTCAAASHAQQRRWRPTPARLNRRI